MQARIVEKERHLRVQYEEPTRSRSRGNAGLAADSTTASKSVEAGAPLNYNYSP